MTDASVTVKWCSIISMVLWLVAAALLTWETVTTIENDGHAQLGVVGAWGLLVGAAAAAWTVCTAVRRANARVMALMPTHQRARVHSLR